MLERVFVVFDVALLRGIDCVISAHGAVLARKPERTSLAVDDVPWYYELLYASRQS